MCSTINMYLHPNLTGHGIEYISDKALIKLPHFHMELFNQYNKWNDEIIDQMYQTIQSLITTS